MCGEAIPDTIEALRPEIAIQLYLIAASPVATSSVHSCGSGRNILPSPISTGIQRYRESHCVRGFQMSPMKITVVALDPTTFSSMVDCDP